MLDPKCTHNWRQRKSSNSLVLLACVLRHVSPVRLELTISRHEMPEAMALNDHAQMRTQDIPYCPELVTEDVIHIPNRKTTGEERDTGKHRLDDFRFRSVGRWQTVYQVQQSTSGCE
jgi:hypothetical protein